MATMIERRSVRARQQVFLEDDHPLVREWLANVINQHQTSPAPSGTRRRHGNYLSAYEEPV